MMENKINSAVRLNLGCGGRPLLGYVNVDMDSLEQLKKRYPFSQFPEGVEVQNYDLFNLPFENNTVEEIRADSLIEHFPFFKEKEFFYEVKRVLKSGGTFRFSTPDFEQTVKDWLNAKDDWKEFFRSDDDAIKNTHWFGTYSYGRENRWGYLMAMIFGTQNGEGQFHVNAYTEGKIRSILKHLGFEVVEFSKDRWKGDRDLMLNFVAKKL